jgi:tetratricopeptide (TPR) repeat protein
MDQMRIGSLVPRFYPSGVTFRFKDLSQKLDETGFDEVVKALKERTRERLIAGLYFNRGQAALNSADLDQAVSEFESALRYEPRSWYGHKHLAEARMLQGTPEAIEQAIDHCRTAIEENAAYASAHCLLADCLAYQGNFGEALFQYEKALALENTRSDFLIRYGLTLAGMSPDEYQEAIQYMQHVQEESQQIQPRTFHGQPWQAAIDKFDRARSLSIVYDQDAEQERVQRAKYHYQRGYAYLQANMLDKALENFTVGRKLAPDDLQLAQAYSYALSLRRKEKPFRS